MNRRGFLRGLVGAVASLVTAPLACAVGPRPPNPLKNIFDEMEITTVYWEVQGRELINFKVVTVFLPFTR